MKKTVVMCFLILSISLVTANNYDMDPNAGDNLVASFHLDDREMEFIHLTDDTEFAESEWSDTGDFFVMQKECGWSCVTTNTYREGFDAEKGALLEIDVDSHEQEDNERDSLVGLVDGDFECDDVCEVMWADNGDDENPYEYSPNYFDEFSSMADIKHPNRDYYETEGEVIYAEKYDSYGTNLEPYDGFTGDFRAYEQDNNEWQVHPQTTDEDIEMIWDSSLERGDENTVKHTLNFEERGHTRIEYNNEDGLVANFNTDAEGTEDIWFYCYTCGDEIFDETSDLDNYGTLPINYETGEDYSFIASREGSDIRFSVEENGGEIWSHTEQDINDFGSTSLESWERWDGGNQQAEQATYTVSNVEVDGTSSPQSENRFFVCRENQQYTVEAEGQIYECNQDTNEWIEYEGDSCEPGHVGYEEVNGEERVVAYYGQDDCTYDTIFDWDWATGDDGYAAGTVDDPIVHTCGIDISHLTVYSDTLPNDECMHASNWDDQWVEAGEMPHVEFGAYRDHFEALLEGRETAETGFVHSDTGWQTQIQPLHEAELEYSPDDNLALDGDWWNDLNMTNVGSESSNTKYYNETTAEDHYIGGQAADPWIIANAGNQSDPISDSSPEFEGGFAGNCAGGFTWTDVDGETADWSCRGEEEDDWDTSTTSRSVWEIPDFTTSAFLPGTSTEDDDDDGDRREIGVVLFPFENVPVDDRPNYVPDEINYYSDLSDRDGELTGVDVRCWTGSLDDRPTDGDGNFDETVDHAFHENQDGLTGEVWSISQTVDVEGSGYACEWAYEVSDSDDLAKGDQEEVIAIHQRGNEDYWEGLQNDYDLEDDTFP